ncbi:hypothetical protein NRB56_55230 [Nocardia sp. RB56]|uniref:Peptidase S11 D-alanyl-D-alanine carboxypeptidase A N-terminal domain-containing protein n=2 Tax=Nocardia aurantia TaxID=2585199 RepID=A0A7K0DVX4_9NOCA|nr:hypothetical protein [Nocardia aurantia]
MRDSGVAARALSSKAMSTRTPRRRPRRLRTLAAATLVAGIFCGTAGTGLDVAVAGAQPAATPPFTTPNTDDCPNKVSPPPPIDTSEVPAPGDPAPTPLPVPSPPIGGPKLGQCGVVLPPGVPPVPAEISATGWVIADLNSGRVLAAKDPHGRYRPASTIKTLLAIVALRSLDLTKVVTGTQEDANAEGTRVGIGPGGRYTNKQLMQALIMCSGNDAAHAIAMQLGGVDATVAKMRAEAERLHAMDTRPATPAGLDGPGMSTSPYDLATIFREAMTIPTFAELIHTEQADFPGFPADPKIPGDKDHPGFVIANDNRLLYDFDGDLGGKTGFTDDARQTFVNAAERGGRRLVITLLKADVLPIRPPEQAARLLEWAFAFPPDAYVGSLPDSSRSGSANPSVTLASPPPHDSDQPGDEDTPTHDDLPTYILAGGILVALGLVIAAWWVSGRGRRRR